MPKRTQMWLSAVAILLGVVGTVLLVVTFPAAAGEPEAGQPDPPLPDWARTCQVLGMAALLLAGVVGALALVAHRRTSRALRGSR